MLTPLYLSFLVNYQLESTYKKAPFIHGGIFSDVILVSNYHGCKEEVANKLNTTLFDRHYLQNCKAITFRKIAIIPNGNKLMF